MKSSRTFPLVLAVAGVLTACSRVTPKTEPAPATPAPAVASAAAPAPAPVPSSAPVAGAPSAGTASTSVGDRLAGATGTVAGRDLATSDPRAVLTEMIFFDYDQSELRAEARATLDAKLAFLQANPSIRIRVAGHTDERGSDEYNIALGMRRAAAAKRYLVDLGIAESRIAVVTFGEERPINTESTEAAWAQNRRDEFEIVAGGTGNGPA
ncbi:MAG: peptidoglycan-associated lipoprotein Pal [Gemmatimonadetes bacterium]|jgi:peptidoglycan-associated lipoprotein|nr:peptidoglycan-associated lipoprotein Pal [Gemmatimonadota bacterium]